MSMKKVYSSIRAGELKKKRHRGAFENHSAAIEFGNGKEDIVYPFSKVK
jgi:hypothetical protein